MLQLTMWILRYEEHILTGKVSDETETKLAYNSIIFFLIISSSIHKNYSLICGAIQECQWLFLITEINKLQSILVNGWMINNIP